MDGRAGQLEIVLVVDLARIDAEGLFVRFHTLLKPLLPVEGVAQVVPCGCCKRWVARFDRSPVGIQGPDVLLRFVEGVPIVEERQRQVGRVSKGLQVLFVRLGEAALFVEAVSVVELGTAPLSGNPTR